MVRPLWTTSMVNVSPRVVSLFFSNASFEVPIVVLIKIENTSNESENRFCCSTQCEFFLNRPWSQFAPRNLPSFFLQVVIIYVKLDMRLLTENKFTEATITLVDPGRRGYGYAPPRLISFFFMQFSRKKGQIIGWHPFEGFRPVWEILDLPLDHYEMLIESPLKLSRWSISASICNIFIFTSENNMSTKKPCQRAALTLLLHCISKKMRL